MRSEKQISTFSGLFACQGGLLWRTHSYHPSVHTSKVGLRQQALNMKISHRLFALIQSNLSSLMNCRLRISTLCVKDREMEAMSSMATVCRSLRHQHQSCLLSQFFSPSDFLMLTSPMLCLKLTCSIAMSLTSIDVHCRFTGIFGAFNQWHRRQIQGWQASFYVSMTGQRLLLHNGCCRVRRFLVCSRVYVRSSRIKGRPDTQEDDCGNSGSRQLYQVRSGQGNPSLRKTRNIRDPRAYSMSEKRVLFRISQQLLKASQMP